MREVALLARREFLFFFRSPQGWVIATVYLALLGLDFNLRVIGGGEAYSADVLSNFFYELSGFTMFFSVFISMGLIARERETQTMSLLLTSPLGEAQIVLGKYFGALSYMVLVTLATLYMPAMILVHGKISVGHLVAGYLGVILLGGAALAIGTFGSALSRSQMMAVFISLGIGAPMVLFWLLGRLADRPLNDIFSYLAIHNLHFAPFKTGKIHLRDVVYYLSVIFFFLFCSARVLESRRWR